jgi:hypothetical protein
MVTLPADRPTVASEERQRGVASGTPCLVAPHASRLIFNRGEIHHRPLPGLAEGIQLCWASWEASSFVFPLIS